MNDALIQEIHQTSRKVTKVITVKLWFGDGSVGKKSTCNTGDTGDPSSIPGSGRPPEEEMPTHPSILAWRIPWTEQPGGLQSTRWQRVRHDWVTNTHFNKLEFCRGKGMGSLDCSPVFQGENIHMSLQDKTNGSKCKQVVNLGKEINMRSFLYYFCRFSVGLTYRKQKVTKTHTHIIVIILHLICGNSGSGTWRDSLSHKTTRSWMPVYWPQIFPMLLPGPTRH